MPNAIDYTQSLTPYHATARTGSVICGQFDRRLREARDRSLFSAYNGRTRRYEIWKDRDGELGRRVHVTRLLVVSEDGTDEGAFVHPDECQLRIHEQLNRADMGRPGADPRKAVQEVIDHNERLVDGRWEAMKAEAKAIAEYVRPWEAQAQDGQPRFPATDVFEGVQAALGEKVEEKP